MSVHYRILDQHLAIVGHTYPHKEAIKALGARFDRNDKIWKLQNTEENLKELEQFCQRIGGGCLDQDKLVKHTTSRTVEKTTNLNEPVTVEIPENSVTVSQLVSKVQLTIATAFPTTVWVVGEIQNLTHRGSGTFFSLAEAKTQSGRSSATVSINSTLWNNTLIHLKSKYSQEHINDLLDDGMKVRVLCQVSLYKDRGQLSLNILDIDPSFTKGALALAREALLKDLRQKGLDKKNKNLTLTKFPFKVGLISADNSRAKTDFTDQLESYGFCGEVLFCDSRMQGDQVTADIPRAITSLIEQHCDIIVITRGGGSAADLRWFDGKEVAMAVANCSLPILAAIGHHEDICIAEEISFRREKTPTAAADFILTIFNNTKDYVQQLATNLICVIERRIEQQRATEQRLRQQLQKVTSNSLNHRSNLLQQLSHNLILRSNNRLIQDDSLLDKIFNQLKQAASQALDSKESSTLNLEKTLTATDPRPWLKKGWTQIYHKDKILKSLNDIEVDQEVSTRILDGVLQLKVTKKEAR